MAAVQLKDFSNVPAVVTITNETDKDIKVMSQPGHTQGFTLPSNSYIKVLANTSAELISYFAQTSNGLTVTWEAKA